MAIFLTGGNVFPENRQFPNLYADNTIEPRILDTNGVRQIRDKTASGDKFLPEFVVEIKNENTQEIARVTKTIYVVRKRSREAA